MKKRLLVSNRRGAARRGVGFSLFVLIGMSTLLGFATQIVTPQTAQAANSAKANEFRYLTYFDRCLEKYLDANGKANDNNNEKIEFSNINEMFKPGEIIAVGADLDGENGVMSCLSVAHKALFYYLGNGNTDTQNSWLMKKLWGREINNNPIKVTSLVSVAVTLQATALRADLKKKIDAVRSVHTKRDTLERMQPLFEQCFGKMQASPPSDETWESGSLSYDKRNIYAQRQRFDWDEIKLNGSGTFKINGNSGINSGTKAEVGDIELDFAPGASRNPGADADKNFKDRSSHWYPLGDDLSTAFGDISNMRFEGEMMANCDIFSAKNTYFFGRNSSDASTHWIIKNNKLYIAEDTNGNGKIDENEITESEAAELGGVEGGGSTDTDLKSARCKIEGALGWVLNPICDIAISSTETLGEYILVALQVEPLTQDKNTGTYEAWKVFRDFANALLVLVFLIAIFAQVLPFEIDPYMVKKVLPKLIAAAIGIQLSFFICQIMVDITNVLGAGTSGFMQTAIDRLPAAAQSSAGSNVASMMFVGVAGVAITIFFIGPVLLLLLAGVISILTMLITIQAREIILVFLAIVSPLAILAWVMPNTEQYAKKWGQNYIKLLLMYPLIVFILTGARLVYGVMSAATTTGGSNTGTSIQQIMINFIPVIAFFMIPATFKASGMITGAIATAGFARAGRSKSRAGGMLKSGYVEPLKSGVKNLSKTAGVKMLGGDSRLTRTAGRALTGNMFSYGKSGRRKIANDIKALKHETLESQVATVKGLNAGNDVIGEMIAARLAGKDQYTYEDRAGEKQTVKLTDDMVAGGIKYLNDNGGQIELAKIGNGTMQYKQQDSKGKTVLTKDRAGKDVEVTNTATAAFNSANGGSFNKIGKFAMGEIFKETTEGNVSALMKAAPHLVHGKKAALYTEAGGDVFAGIKGDSMDVATKVITGDNTGKAQENFADALVEIMQSSARSGGMDKKTSEKMRDLILADPRVGAQKIDLGDGKAVALNTVTDKIFTSSGKITYYDTAKRMP